MAGAVVQLPTLIVDEGAASTTIQQTITGVTAGNTIVAFVGWDDATSAITCSVSDGTSYAVGAAKITDGNLQAGQVFYLENAGAGSHTVVATVSQSTDFRRLRLFEISGVLTSGALATGTGQSQSGPGTGSNAVSSGASSSTGATCFVMGFSQDTSQASPGTGTVTAGTNYTIIGSSIIMAAESRASVASGAQTATFTQSVNNDRITHVVAFKESSSGGTTTTKTMTDTVTITDQNVRVAYRVRQMSEAITLTDTPVYWRMLKRVADESVAMVDSVVKTLISAGGTVYTKVMTETISLTDTFFDWLRRVRGPIDTITLDDGNTYRSSIITASESIDVTDGFVSWRRYKRVAQDTFDVIDGFSKILAGTGIVYAKVLSDTVTLIDDAGQRWRLRVSQLTDTVGLSDAVIRAVTRVRALGDVVEFIDGTVNVRRFTRSMDEGMEISDSRISTLILDQMSNTSFVFGASSPPFRFGGN